MKQRKHNDKTERTSGNWHWLTGWFEAVNAPTAFVFRSESDAVDYLLRLPKHRLRQVQLILICQDSPARLLIDVDAKAQAVHSGLERQAPQAGLSLISTSCGKKYPADDCACLCAQSCVFCKKSGLPC